MNIDFSKNEILNAQNFLLSFNVDSFFNNANPNMDLTVSQNRFFNIDNTISSLIYLDTNNKASGSI